MSSVSEINTINKMDDMDLIFKEKYSYLSSINAKHINFHQAPTGHPFIHWDDIISQICLLDFRLNKTIKRLIDIILSLLVIIFMLSWAMPLIALGIKLNSIGPVFFYQKRKGYKGKVFICIKFRSMYLNDQSDVLPVTQYDTRITAFGKFLRKYYLDELPQFFNVLAGNMTLVGPRPHMVNENNFYEKVIENYSIRYKVKPGITGLGQINNHCKIGDRHKMENRIYWDMLYIRNWSCALDMWILYKTCFYCLQAKNQI